MPSFKRSLSDRKKKHIAVCPICQHPLKKEIEEDYLHCVPFRHIRKVYGIHSDRIIISHARFFGLEEKRNRDFFYWQFIENVDFEKGIRPEHALAAAMHLDRLQGRLSNIPQGPTNIQIIYKYPERLGFDKRKIELNEQPNIESSDRLRAESDTASVSSEQS